MGADFDEFLNDESVEFGESAAGYGGNQEHFAAGGFAEQFCGGGCIGEFCFGDAEDFRAFGECGVVEPQFFADLGVVIEWIGLVGRGGFDEVYEEAGAFDVAEEFVAESGAGVGAFDESGDISEHIFVVVTDMHESEVGVFGGEGVIGNFGSGAGNPAEQSGFSGIGFADEPDVGDEFQFELDFAVFAGVTAFGFAWGAVDGICKAFVAAAAATAFGDNDRVTVILQVFEEVTVFEVTDECSGGHEDNGGFAAFSRTECTQAVFAAFGFPVPMTNEVTEGTEVAIRLNDDIATVAAVAPVRAAAWYKGFTPETAAAVSSVACTTI